MNPWQDDMCRHFADDARIAPVPGQSRIGRVAVGEQRGFHAFGDTGARHKGRNAICTQIGDDLVHLVGHRLFEEPPELSRMPAR